LIDYLISPASVYEFKLFRRQLNLSKIIRNLKMLFATSVTLWTPWQKRMTLVQNICIRSWTRLCSCYVCRRLILRF